MENNKHTSYYFAEENNDPDAGIYQGWNDIKIIVTYGVGGEPGEFEEFMRQSLSDWFDTKVKIVDKTRRKKMTKLATVTAIFMLILVSTASATEFDYLSGDLQEKFKLAADGAAMAIHGAPANAAHDRLASDFAHNNPPYAKLWRWCTIVDNSAFPGGTAAYVDIDIETATHTQIQAIIGGPFGVLAEMLYPELVE